MPFSDAQKNMLDAPLSSANVKDRKQGSRTLSYVEAWYVIDRANQIFGFDGWSSEVVVVQCVVDVAREIGENKVPGWGVTYICKVRVGVGGLVREGCGAGHGIDRDRGLAHESALKEAESDARKRALMTLGYQFGLALYDKDRTHVIDEEDAFEASRQKYLEQCRKKIDSFVFGNRDILIWWNSEAEYKARRDYELTPAEVEQLKALVIAKLPARHPNE